LPLNLKVNVILYEIERKWQKNQGTVEPLDCK
jgi:hypothetical protein